MALPAVLLLLAFLLAGSAAGITQLRLEDAARAGARALARGESTGFVEDVVRRLAGSGASVAVASDGEWMTVTASARVSGPLGAVIPWTLSATSSVRPERPVAAVVHAAAQARAFRRSQEDGVQGREPLASANRRGCRGTAA